MSDSEEIVNAVAKARRGVSPVCAKELHDAAKATLKTKMFQATTVKMIHKHNMEILRRIRRKDREEGERQTKPERLEKRVQIKKADDRFLAADQIVSDLEQAVMAWHQKNEKLKAIAVAARSVKKEIDSGAVDAPSSGLSGSSCGDSADEEDGAAVSDVANALALVVVNSESEEDEAEESKPSAAAMALDEELD